METELAKAKIYTDFHGFENLKSGARKESPEALRAAAEQFEGVFLQMVLKSMRDANAAMGESIFSSGQVKFYESMFDQQLTLNLSGSGSLGLADMVVKQLSKLGNSGAIVDPNNFPSKIEPVENKSNKLITSQLKELELPLPFRDMLAKNNDDSKVNDKVIEASKEVDKSKNILRFNSPSEFVSALLPHAKQAAKILGVSPKILIAQAALETGWGKSIIKRSSTDSSHNLFGIKADKRWKSDKVNVTTLEYSNGIANKERANFRSYDSFSDSFNDYVNFLQKNPRYRHALQNTESPERFVKELQKAGYATDPNYAKKIINLYNSDAIKNSPTSTKLLGM